MMKIHRGLLFCQVGSLNLKAKSRIRETMSNALMWQKYRYLNPLGAISRNNSPNGARWQWLGYRGAWRAEQASNCADSERF